MHVRQVISEFTSVVTSADVSSNRSSAGYPSSAVGFAGLLSFSNFDITAFLPLGCFALNTTFHDALVLRTLTPIVIIGLLWSRPLGKMIIGERSVTDERAAARWSLVILEMIVLGVSTQIVQTFPCDEFDDGSFLRAQVGVSFPFLRVVFHHP